MMKVWVYSLASVLVVSLMSLVGIFTICLNGERLKKILIFLVSFAVGGLFGDAFIHILPEAYKDHPPEIVSFGVIAGIILFFILEKFIYWRHCHSGHCDMHSKPFIVVNVVGDALHNFIDGVIIGASYAANIGLGIATTIAVVLHEIPQEIGDYSILIEGGLSRWRALVLNFLCASTAVLGTVLALTFGSMIKDFTLYALPVTAGGFIYLAGSDLMPELHKEVKLSRSIMQLLSIIAGVFVMALLLFLD